MRSSNIAQVFYSPTHFSCENAVSPRSSRHTTLCSKMDVQCVLLLLTLSSFVFINGDELKKRDVPASEMDAIFADDNKQKRSEEVMFGNQQNKPAGMIDDALSGMVGKRGEIKKKDTTDIDQSESEESDAPVVSEGGIEGKTNNLEDNEEEQSDGDAEFNDNEIPRDFPMPDYEGLEEDPMLRDAWYQYRNLKRNNADWREYPPLFNGIYRRRRRALLNRDIRSPLEKLLLSDKGGRFKRDLHMSEDDMLNLLELLAEDPRLQQVLRDPERIPVEIPNEVEFLGDAEGAADEEGARLPSLADYYGAMMNDENPNGEEIPEWALMGPASRIEMRRRAFYPPMDYRVLGLPGQKRDGLWGHLEEPHRARLYPSGYNDPEEVEIQDPYMENVMEGDLEEPIDLYRRLML